MFFAKVWGQPVIVAERSLRVQRNQDLGNKGTPGLRPKGRCAARTWFASIMISILAATRLFHKQGAGMSFLKEFREFAVKGNVIDLAVGVIIGGAFGKIVESLVADVIMPVVGLVFGKLDFSNLYLVLGPKPPNVADTLVEIKKAGVPVLAYGSFITIAVNFVILAFIIFMMVRQINRLRKIKDDAPSTPIEPPPPPEEVVLLREIRDSLKQR
jgi:large conductance mechanosensitive channel